MEKWNPPALLLGMQNGTATVKSSIGLPKKIKIKFSDDSVIPLMRIYPKEPKN